jgi:hypothetical protein
MKARQTLLSLLSRIVQGLGAGIFSQVSALQSGFSFFPKINGE